jgi:hypothetical protein
MTDVSLSLCAGPGGGLAQTSALEGGWRIRADGFCRHVCAFPTMGAHIATKGVATYAPPALLIFLLRIFSSAS